LNAGQDMLRIVDGRRVLARIIEPTGQADTVRVLAELACPARDG